MVTSSVVRSGDDGDYGSMVGEKLGKINHGNHVALSHEWKENKVSGSHGRGTEAEWSRRLCFSGNYLATIMFCFIELNAFCGPKGINQSFKNK